MKKLHVTVAVIGIAAAGAAAYWYQNRPNVPVEASAGAVLPADGVANAVPNRQAGTVQSNGPVAVEVGKVEVMRLADAAQAVGTLRSRQGVILRPEVAGRIATIGFKDGERVRKGQLLVQLDDAVLRAQVQQAQAQVNIARANDERNRELLAENFVSKAAVDQSGSNLEVAQAQLALARAQLARMKILAPFDATAGIRQINVGDYVKDGADIVNLEDISTVYVDFRLPERYLSQLKVGQSAQVNLDALPGRQFTARIAALDPQVDANGRSVLVRGAMDNAEGVLRPGMFARVDTTLSTRAEALVVPEEALVPQGGKQYVIKVVDAAGAQGNVTKVSQRSEVRIGMRRAGKVEILQGVNAGETIVVAGHQRVQRDGALLQVVELGGPERAPSAEGASAGSVPRSVAPGTGASAPRRPTDSRLAANSLVAGR